jgi:hypothetical protein
VHLTKEGLRIAESAVEHLANHSALGSAMSQFTPEERKRGSAFALRILSMLESAQVDSEGESDEPPRKSGRPTAATSG